MPVQPTQVSAHSKTPGCTRHRFLQGVWAGQIPGPLPKHSQEDTKEARKLWDTNKDDKSPPETCLHPSATVWVWARFLREVVERRSLGGLFGQEGLPWAVTPRWRGRVLPCLTSLISCTSGGEPVPRQLGRVDVAGGMPLLTCRVFSANTWGNHASVSQKQKLNQCGKK